MMVEKLRVFAGCRSDGSRVFEEILAEPLEEGRYLLLRSPGLVLGVAADDVFELREDGQINVISRGRNVCIQVYCSQVNPELEQALARYLTPYGGRLDGKSSRELVYTVPVDAGFTRIEEALKTVLESFPSAEWYYGNVYDSKDGITPLNWW